MTTQPDLSLNRWFCAWPALITARAAVALALIAAGGAPALATALRLNPAGPSPEGVPTYELDWDARSNATYLVQSATSLAADAPWATLDAVTPVDGIGRWPLPPAAGPDLSGDLASPPAVFYRLILPSAQIFSVEPAVIAPGVPVDFYVLGQNFPSNALVLINGAKQSGTVYADSGTLVQPAFTPVAAGTYQVSLVIGGVVVSTFAVVCADPLANPELVWQGPPTQEPPSSPSARWLSKKGYDYWKAQSDSDYSFDVEQTLNIGSQSSAAGAGRKDFKGHVTLLKAFDDGSDNSSARTHTKTGHVTLMKAFDDDASSGERQVRVSNLGSSGQDGVALFSGEVEAWAVDLAIPGRDLDFIWARTYHSRIGRFGAATNGWTFSYDVRCAQNGTGGLDVYDGTGRKDTYSPGTNGVYVCPENFREGTVSNKAFTLTFADTGRWVFNPFDGTASAGKLHQVITRNGTILTLGYTTGGQIAQIVDGLGRNFKVAYNSAGQVAAVTDFTGRRVAYQYYSGAPSDEGSAGDLASVTTPAVIGTPNGNDFPSGKTTTYTYSKGYPQDRDNHLLLSVTDAKGQTAAAYTYEHNGSAVNYLRCVAAQEGTNGASIFNWEAVASPPTGGAARISCTVNDPVGNVSQFYFDARNRCVREVDYTGRATPGLPVSATANRPAGKLRSSDPDYYEARWSWNNDSLCTTEMAPDGRVWQYVYQSDFDPTTPARKRADCRVARELASSAVDVNGDGVADVTARTWYYSYDPRFGSCGPAAEWYQWRKCVLDGKVDRRSLSIIFHNDAGEEAGSRGCDGTIKGRAISTKGTGSIFRKAIGTKGTGSVFRGWDGTVKGLVVPEGNGMAIRTKGTGADKNRVGPSDGMTWVTDLDFNDQSTAWNFAVSVTDPRGHSTMASYDPQGNLLLRFRKRPEILFQQWDDAFAYDSLGQLIAHTNALDATGRRRVDTFAWSQGQITNCVVDAGGLALTAAFEYDLRGNLTRWVDPRTNDWLFTYNALDQLVQASSAPADDGSGGTFRTVSQFTYDANDNVVQAATELRDPAGTLTGSRADNYQYDGEDRLSQLALAMDASWALTNRYAYDGNNECVQIAGPDAVAGADPGQTVVFQYDERGLVFQACAAPGTLLAVTNQYSYDADGRSSGHAQEKLDLATETWTYDGFGRRASVTDAMGNVTTYYYDLNDNPTVVRRFGELNDVPGVAGNVRLAESHYEYDGLDRRFRTHDLFFDPATQSPLGGGDAVASQVLAPNGECVSVTDSLGRTTSFAYDTAGRSTSAIRAGAIAGIVVARDASGNVTSSTETDASTLGGPAQVFTTSYVYDRLNRCVSASDNVGNTVTYAYDSLGRVVRETNPNGNDTTYAYDLLGDCLTRTEYAGSSVAGGGKLPAAVRSLSATYDTSGRCLTFTDPNGNLTRYAYDSVGDCTLMAEADGTQQSLTWSPRSNRLAVTDANGTTVTNYYDLRQRIVHRDIACRNVLATTTFETFAYDGCDRLVLASNDASSLSFRHDSLDDCIGSAQDGLAQSATYDTEGNRLSLVYPGGRVVTYAYDALNQVTNVGTFANGVAHPQLARFAYAGPGRLARIGRDNGIRTQIDWDGLTNPGNGPGDYGWQEVSRVRDGTAASPSLVCDVAGTYSRTQSKLTRADAGRSSLTLSYDPLEQLVESLDSLRARDTLYALDAAGNRSHVITNGVLMTPDYAMNSALPPGDFLMNRYTTTPFGAQSYDANGNLTVRAGAAGPTLYHYDYADRLVEVDGMTTMGALGPVATFTYDALGNRTSKTTYPAAPAAPVTTQYLNALVEYKDGEDGTMHTRPGNHKPGRPSVLEARVIGSISQSFCELAAFTAAGEIQYYHYDDLGNVLALSGPGGNVLERYAYDDYGQPQFLTADGLPLTGSDGQPVKSSPQGNPYLFRNQAWDAETGLLDQGGGDYFDPPTGRAVRGKVKIVRDTGNGCAAGNSPYSPN